PDLERLFPVYHAFHGLSRLAGRQRLAVSVPAGLAAVAVRTADGSGMVVANLTAATRGLALPEPARFVVLDAAQQDPHWLQSAPRASGGRLTLPPHAVAFATIGSLDLFGSSQ